MYVPRGRRSQTTPPAATTTNLSNSSLGTTPPNSQSPTKIDDTPKLSNVIISTSNSKTGSSFTSNINRAEATITSDTTIETDQISDVDSNQIVPSRKQPQDTNRSPCNLSPIKNMSAVPVKSDDCSKKVDKEYNEEKEFQRASKVIVFRTILIFFKRSCFSPVDSFIGNKSSQSPYYKANI